MKAPLGDWCRTDVHLKAIQSTALFEYRLVMQPFKYPPRPVKKGLRRQPTRLPPTLEVVMMDQDRHTRDDRLGGVALNLEDLPLPDTDMRGCGVASLAGKRVNLFDAAAVRRFRRQDAVFPRELTGYWPLLKKKKINRELKAVGSIRLTIQLLTAKEAAKYPAAQGNKAWALNRFPTLAKPEREHGRIRDKIILGTISAVELAIARVTGIPNLRTFIVIVIIVAFLRYKVEKEHVEALAKAAYRLGRHCVQHPYATLVLSCCFTLCALCVSVWREASAPRGDRTSAAPLSEQRT